MRYSKTFDTFKTSTWKKLWENNIPDLDSLKELIGKSGFVAIDMEPYGISQTQVTEIGLSYVPPFLPPFPVLEHLETKHLNDNDSPKIKKLCKKYNIQRRCFRVSANERREKNREPYEFGTVEAIEEADIERTLIDAVTDFTGPNPNSKPVLVGFSLGYELKIITTQWPRLVDSFSAWIDLQEIASDVSEGRYPSMRDTLIALGFEHDRQAVRGRQTTHNAGTDALRISAMLLRLRTLTYELNTPRLEIGKSIRHKCRPWIPKRTVTMRKFWKTKPTPRELYPFIARVSVDNNLSMFSLQGLMDYFSEYSPVAVGINDGGRRYGWVCLGSLAQLRQFVQEVNQKPYGDSGAWTAIEDYDPSVVPVESSSELIARRRADQEAQREQKRLERAQKRNGSCDTEG